MKKLTFLLLVSVVALFGAYIRLAPSDPGIWHATPLGDVDRDTKDGVIRLFETGPEGLARLDVIARDTPRTRVLAGSVEEGMVTYVTRSLVMGFPDYTTVRQDGDTLRIHGRLRFGRSDFGVNRVRVDGWLALLHP